MTNYKAQIENSKGMFGQFGGMYVSEMLLPIMIELEACFEEAKNDPKFLEELSILREDFTGRPTPLFYCENLTKEAGGAKIYLKNEGLLHTGAHKINHCLGQGLIAKRLGKTRIVAETGAGQHGLATATMCARLNLECVIYMGAKDVARQRPNVFWMEKLGATVIPVTTGGQVLNDAINESMRDLVSNPHNSHFLHGTVCASHPYPKMNTFFQSIIGKEIREQLLKKTGKKPNAIVACAGGGSNSIGAFFEFLDDPEVELIGIEAGGKGIHGNQHAARFQGGRVGVNEGMKTYFLQNEEGQMSETSSISAGLDYCGISPIAAWLHEEGRVQYDYCIDKDVMAGWKMMMRTEGLNLALESSHAILPAMEKAKSLAKDDIVVINASGRGDKDLFIFARELGDKSFKEFLKTQI